MCRNVVLVKDLVTERRSDKSGEIEIIVLKGTARYNRSVNPLMPNLAI